MHPFELKQIANLFWRGSSTQEEKTPIVKKSIKVPDNGSIARETKMNGSLESKSTYDSLIGTDADSVEEDSNGKSKMTLMRKLCFFLSLNGGIVYVAALLWLIPCRHPLCMNLQNWTANISGQLTTNMEIKSTLLTSSVIFGMTDEDGGKLASLLLFNGTMGWNKSTENVLKDVFCDLDYFDDYSDNHLHCLVTANNYIADFNTSNGVVLWERYITDPANVKIRKVAMARKRPMGQIVIAVSDEEMFLLMARNGTLVSTIDLPCSWTVDMKLVGPMLTANETSWILTCEYEDTIEVWTFLEEEVLSLPEEFDEGPFRLLFRGNGNGGSIDLAGDVTRTPNSLALSWADSVVMVTSEAPFHHLRKTWERRFGDTSAVTSIVFGRFTNSTGYQIAATIQDGSNTTLHILEYQNGTSKVITNLGMRSVMSMHRIANGDRGLDTLVIEAISPYEEEKNSSSSASKATRREYFTLMHKEKTAVFENIATVEAYASSFNQFTEGAANLLIASPNPDSGTIISRYVLISKLEDKCF